MTEEQYRARVSHKAYELYEKRQAATPLEDWLEAERLVKLISGRGPFKISAESTELRKCFPCLAYLTRQGKWTVGRE